MATTTESAVRQIIKTKLASAEVQQFIDDAALWVSEEINPAEVSAGRLEIIERYLACALIRTRELGIKSATFKEISETYQTDLYVTDYLKRAASFDPTGKVRMHFLENGDGTRRTRFRVGSGFEARA